MFTPSGIALDSFVRIEGDCAVRCAVVSDEVELEIGRNPCVLNLVCTEQALEALVSVTSSALDQLRHQAVALPPES